MTSDQLKKILPNLKYVDAVCKSINDTCDIYQINTRNRLCHFLAQILHESGGLKFSEELASGQQYEGRKDLGNIKVGDGKKYKGRGYIQITGRFNYNEITNYYKSIVKRLESEKLLVRDQSKLQEIECKINMFTVDFIEIPEKLSQNPHNIISAGWFWNEKKLNSLADLNNIIKITKVINGGLNGLSDRKKWLEICFNVIK